MQLFQLLVVIMAKGHILIVVQYWGSIRRLLFGFLHLRCPIHFKKLLALGRVEQRILVAEIIGRLLFLGYLLFKNVICLLEPRAHPLVWDLQRHLTYLVDRCLQRGRALFVIFLSLPKAHLAGGGLRLPLRQFLRNHLAVWLILALLLFELLLNLFEEGISLAFAGIVSVYFPLT